MGRPKGGKNLKGKKGAKRAGDSPSPAPLSGKTRRKEAASADSAEQPSWSPGQPINKTQVHTLRRSVTQNIDNIDDLNNNATISVRKRCRSQSPYPNKKFARGAEHAPPPKLTLILR